MSEFIQNRALTGVRPTGDLTIANYLGAIQPIIDMQDTFDGEITVFVADIHGLTDQEPEVVRQNVISSARSLVAAGIDTDKTNLYLQSQIENETIWLAHMLDRHTTPAELTRVPTLKDKLKGTGNTDQVNMALFRYPVLMAADIAIQAATHVPVGEDQVPHIEFTRRLVRRFNNAYGNGHAVLVEPKGLEHKPLRIAALQESHGKMSKSQPSSALLLRDDPDTVAKKIKKAQTAVPGEMPVILESHFTLVELLSRDPERSKEVQRLKAAHIAGEAVMGAFKSVMTDTVNDFLENYRNRYSDIDESDVKRILVVGGERAKEQANEVVQSSKAALGLTSAL